MLTVLKVKIGALGVHGAASQNVILHVGQPSASWPRRNSDFQMPSITGVFGMTTSALLLTSPSSVAHCSIKAWIAGVARSKRLEMMPFVMSAANMIHQHHRGYPIHDLKL